MTIKNMILIGAGLLVLVVLSVMGYLWYTTEKSPSIMGGGYDRDMEEQQVMQGEAASHQVEVRTNPVLEENPKVPTENMEPNKDREEIIAYLTPMIEILQSDDPALIRTLARENSWTSLAEMDDDKIAEDALEISLLFERITLFWDAEYTEHLKVQTLEDGTIRFNMYDPNYSDSEERNRVRYTLDAQKVEGKWRIITLES